jgi:cytochrome oxidase Cu insertion factor (SCO1/SenC/PrrC family)
VRLRFLLTAALALALGGALMAILAFRPFADNRAARFRGSEPPPGISLPDFSLRDWTGEPVRSPALRGKVVLVTFLSSACTDACPVVAGHIDRALDLLDRNERVRVVPIAISVDPEIDTRANVRSFLRRHRVEGQLRYLVGSVGELRPVWSAFAITSAVETGDSDIHSAPVRVFDPEGTWVSTLHSGADLTPESLAHDARAALDAVEDDGG